MNKGLSRRDFVKGASLSVGAGAFLGLSGCSSTNNQNDASTDKSQTTGQLVNPASIKWDEEYDVLIVGAGLAGSTAAMALAAEGNGETCLLIEKSNRDVGDGNSAVSGGSVIYTDQEYKEDCKTYFKKLRGTFDTTPDDVIDAYVEYMASNVEFFEKIGASRDNFTLYEPGKVHLLEDSGSEDYHSAQNIVSCWPEYPEIKESIATGRMIFSGEKENSTFSKFMVSAMKQHPDVITYRLNSALKRLIQDPDTKAILGGVYEDENEKEVAVKANKGVIMCLGGFERNPEMVQDYLSMPDAVHIGGSSNTGDGFKICYDVGADFWHMNSMAGTWNGAIKTDGKSHAMWFTLGRQYGITVGIHGRRYYMDVDYVVAQNWTDYKNNEADLRTTTSCRHGHYNFGGEWPHVVLPAKSWFIFDDEHLEQAVRGGVMKLTEKDPVEEGWAVKADSIIELAKIIGVPEKELVQTVDIWNECCERGVDVQFYRAQDWLTPVKTAPFYAVQCEPEFINTDGGPVRNAKAQILDTEGNVIPNLYSSGEFGSIWCNMYQGGGNLSECVQFSRIAVDTILGK